MGSPHENGKSAVLAVALVTQCTADTGGTMGFTIPGKTHIHCGI
jgi:hypothetical protein